MNELGPVTSAWRVRDVRAAEAAALAVARPEALMRRAAGGVARRCAQLLAEGTGVYGAPVMVLAGAGNNGGDALFAGAALARRGAVVTALVGPTYHQRGAAALEAAGGRVCPRKAYMDNRWDAVLVLDGLLGIGARGGIRDELVPLISAVARARASGATVLAVDVPSGVNVDTGAVEGAAAIAADVTVTFGCHKPGLHVGAGARHAGLVELVQLGFERHLSNVAPAVAIATAAAVASWWPSPQSTDDKYTRGVAGIVAGSATYPGAALLATSGALAGPAGMTRYVGSAVDHVVSAHPEIVATQSLDDAGRVQAWVCGPGLGTDVSASRLLRQILATDVPVLIDGDAITLAAHHLELLRRRRAPLILTPHDREFERIAGPVGNDRLACVRAVASDLSATVLLKGDRTIVASPGQTPLLNPTGVPELATAGSGDVLSGLIGALLAGGVEPHRAAAAGAFVHGLTGSAVARESVVTASRLAAALPSTVAALRQRGWGDIPGTRLEH